MDEDLCEKERLILLCVFRTGSPNEKLEKSTFRLGKEFGGRKNIGPPPSEK